MDENSGKNTLKIIALISSIGGLPLFLMIFTLFVVVLFVLGLFGDGSGNGGTAATKICGFNISSTSLSQSEFKEKIESFALNGNSSFQIFADNANDIYKYAKSKNINPELVVVRAYVEGHGTTTGTNNYWGIGCNNGGGLGACHSYSSFEEGYTNFIDLISQYDSLEAMMSKYAYIGAYWFNPGSSADGGCYYAEYIYPNNMPDRVKNACSSSAPLCSIGGGTGCTATTDEDQQAYATWQIKTNMGAARKTIFGLEYDEGPCVSSSLQPLSEYNFGHTNLKVLDKKLSATEQSNLNNYINNEVDKAGYGSGEGVAAAAQALVYWLEKKGYYLEYSWAGGHCGQGAGVDGNCTFVGVNPNWGSTEFGCDSHGRCHNGMDCSGFVSWATRTACDRNFGSNVSGTWTSYGSAISLKDAKPGDVIAWSGHIQLIVKNNGDGSVIVAEETGSPTSGLVFTQITSTSHSVIDMSHWYQTNCNKIR